MNLDVIAKQGENDLKHLGYYVEDDRLFVTAAHAAKLLFILLVAQSPAGLPRVSRKYFK